MIRDEDKEIFLSLSKLIKTDSNGNSNSGFLMWAGSKVINDMFSHRVSLISAVLVRNKYAMEGVFDLSMMVDLCGIMLNLKFENQYFDNGGGRLVEVSFKKNEADNKLVTRYFDLDDRHEIKECVSYFSGLIAGHEIALNKGV